MKINTTIATLGSHSALQIMKGAKDEGFRTMLIALHDKASFYRRFPFIDKVIGITRYSDFPKVEKQLKKETCILIPHGSFVAYLGKEGNKRITIPYFGNKKVLDWEEDRRLQRQWIVDACILMPQEFTEKTIKFPVIVKTFGAAGGSGYFLAANKKEFTEKIRSIKSSRYVIQQYIVGVTCYLHYFYSPLTNVVELMSIDRRYETNVDGLGRIPSQYQHSMHIDPSYVVVGNSSLVLRESLLPEAYAMGERIVATSKKLIDRRGLIGPFCLETVITPDQRFYAMEISCRIVAGTNLFIEGSPYSWLTYNEPMSTGRRIAREIKFAITKNKLDMIID
ncbi:MAG TPA: formate--phosphoribosylaminoimidazolecarboxamide ligase [Patescibacteria group bacterium]|nr:formate--phosphoribosylaminoimidazolecarboxamide ligase [Patescibacteria group bacterium]